ncbi:MAG: hypothetical protein IIC12_00380, partial [Proteobacteria bacterium]|nr:hypothetical protein [Pseudomonadota bacterium]
MGVEVVARKLGKMLNVERIIIGSVGLVGKTYTIYASIVDVESSRILQIADFNFKGEVDNLLTKGIPYIVNQLFRLNIDVKEELLKKELPALSY